MQLRPRLVRPGSDRQHELRLRSTVKVHHPGYKDDALLLSLPATDGAVQNPGVHHITVLTACGIIANNRFDGYLSTSKNPQVDHKAVDNMRILPPDDYFYHLDPPEELPINAPSFTAYPIVPSFRAWQFPPREQHKHIPGWNELEIPESDLTSESSVILARDRGCRLTDSRLGLQIAHIIPRPEIDWFVLNEMHKYCPNSTIGGDIIINQAVNNIMLRVDVHKSWDDHKLLFVPKKSEDGQVSLVAHVCENTAPGEELLELYHNVQLQSLQGISKECLFARFALSILKQQLGTFLRANRPRWLAMQLRTGEERGDVQIRQVSGDECKLLGEDVAGSRTGSPGKRSRTREGDRDQEYDLENDDQSKTNDEDKRKRARFSDGSFDSGIAGFVHNNLIDDKDDGHGDPYRSARRGTEFSGWITDDDVAHEDVYTAARGAVAFSGRSEDELQEGEEEASELSWVEPPNPPRRNWEKWDGGDGHNGDFVKWKDGLGGYGDGKEEREMEGVEERGRSMTRRTGLLS